jgi:hypothetical protein
VKERALDQRNSELLQETDLAQYDWELSKEDRDRQEELWLCDRRNLPKARETEP